MANLSEAYDFSLFEDRIGQSTAPIGEPGSREQRQEQKRENVIELPQKELDKNRKELDKLETKLNNPGFVNKAPANVVEAERERADKLKALLVKLEESAAALG